MRRNMDDELRLEAAAIKTRQAEAAASRRTALRLKAVGAKLAAAKAKKALLAKEEKEKAKALKAKLDALPRKLTSADAGAAGAAGIKARSDALERIKLRSPALDFAREAHWDDLRESFAKHTPIRFKKDGGAMALGTAFVREINALMKKMGCAYKGLTDYNKPGSKGEKSGDATAFDKFYDSMEARIPVEGVVCVI